MKWLAIIQIIVGFLALVLTPNNQGLHALVVVMGVLLLKKAVGEES